MGKTQKIIDQALEAERYFQSYDQKQTDKIVREIFLVALKERVSLAKLAHEETGIGRWQDKVIKNVIASQLVYEDIKKQKTVGVISEDLNGIVEIAKPLGPILGFIPITNPTSTTIFKILIAMKTRNPLIISPHQSARRSITQTAKICYEAAIEAGAPSYCIQWLEKPSPGIVDELMSHPCLALILATGSNQLVRKAQTSGTPTIGVGPGNVPVYIGSTADIPFAVRGIIQSKTFDHGTVCASEQAVVVKEEDAHRIIHEFKRQGVYFLSSEEIQAVSSIAYDLEQGRMVSSIVGKSVHHIAKLAHIAVPKECQMLMAHLNGIGKDYPLSAEILAPILAFYIEKDFDAAIERCSEITRFGGIGHTAVIYSNNDERIEYFSQIIDAGRILVNMPSTHGALGGIYNTLHPSFTLSCGSGGNNITTDNITTRHLLNIHRIARRRPNPKWMAMEMETYLDESLSSQDLEDKFNKNY